MTTPEAQHSATLEVWLLMTLGLVENLHRIEAEDPDVDNHIAAQVLEVDNRIAAEVLAGSIA
jgi:hypothetical protein